MIERDLHLTVCGKNFLVDRIETTQKSEWWCFLKEDSSPSYTGIEVDPISSELPASIDINGVSVTLVPVKKWDRLKKEYSDVAYPFEKTRHFADYVEIEGAVLEIRFRVTAKKNGKWNLSCRAWQTRKPSGPPHKNSRRIRPEPTPSNPNVARGRELPSGGIFDLFN